MNDLDTLRPEVQAAMRELREALRVQGVGSHGPQFTIIRAELLRLTRDRDHARQMHADRDEDLQHEWLRAEKAEAELAALKARMRPVARVENGEVRALMDHADEGKYVAVLVVEE